jgi:hypothetical protein
VVIVCETDPRDDEAARRVALQLNRVGAVSCATAVMLACNGRVTEVVSGGYGRPVQVR